MINKAHDLPFDDPQETDSSSEHFLHDQGITPGTTGRIVPEGPSSSNASPPATSAVVVDRRPRRPGRTGRTGGEGGSGSAKDGTSIAALRHVREANRSGNQDAGGRPAAASRELSPRRCAGQVSPTNEPAARDRRTTSRGASPERGSDPSYDVVAGGRSDPHHAQAVTTTLVPIGAKSQSAFASGSA